MDHVFLATAYGLLFFFSLTGIITFWVFRCRKPKITQLVSTTTQLPSITTVDQSASFDPNLKFSMTKLRAATKNFSPEFVIGGGSFGTVYKAQLSNGVTVAIKRLNPDAFKGFREFWAEMVTLGMLHHPNIAKIFGYCISGSDRLLIYEFFQNGSLDRWLHLEQEQDVDTLTLSWGTRIQIVKGVANGLFFLHSLDKPIAHQDIKSRNVFLDSDFQAHICDFGHARRIDTSTSYASTQSAGTVGYCYMPPEYKAGLTTATLEADVYSFGILMFEIATGKRPNLPTLLDGEEVGIVEWARKMLAQDKHMQMVDASILTEGGLIEAHVKEYFEIAEMWAILAH
ncbi:leucine-rich repeat receptor protein kinase EMS1-like [Quercus robur]|uniref:leucine-rich repeat receptor protein kinase EMS1-like n=1 Tax=Quercus robur TaxID=38942 RepID=UPI0021630765|nr:leucine-rich repeat receptor protein kinase EMS1-like [Quercus robur]